MEWQTRDDEDATGTFLASPAVTAPVVLADRLSKRFGNLTALDQLDLIVNRGEVFGYLGPNGAGKTTTIRLLIDALRPTDGKVLVLGGAPRDPATRARIGYLPAELRVDPRYRGNDLLEFFGALRGGLDRAYARQLCERFGLDPTRPAKELSTGNRRKIGVVQAFVHRPELLILDEPTSGLDPLLQHAFHELVKEVVADGATVFLSSHVLPEVEALADRVGIVRRGQLVDIATVDELRARARQRIELHVEGDGPTAAAMFDGVHGVVSSTADDRVVHLVVEGSVDAALKAAAHLTVARIVTLDTDLEDVFLAYYRDDDP
jgi:ABC-2 type transport system ATP-binding protein